MRNSYGGSMCCKRQNFIEGVFEYSVEKLVFVCKYQKYADCFQMTVLFRYLTLSASMVIVQHHDNSCFFSAMIRYVYKNQIIDALLQYTLY